VLPERVAALLDLADVDAHLAAAALPLLFDPDPQVRAAAAALAARHPTAGEKLRAARAAEQDERVRRVFDLALLLHGDDDAIEAAEVADALAHAWDPEEVEEALAELELGRAQRAYSMLTDLVAVTRD
jgi:hypothetical protein